MENPTLDEISKKYLESIEGTTLKKNIDFSNLGGAKIESLQETLQEIQKLIEERKELSTNVIKDTEKMKHQIENFLLENKPQGEDDTEFARERAELRKKQIELTEVQVNEKIKCWNDIALLKKEQREKEKELNEKINRTEMLETLLGEE